MQIPEFKCSLKESIKQSILNFNWKAANQCLIVNVSDTNDLVVLKELTNGSLLSVQFTEPELAMIIDSINEYLEDLG